MNTRQAFGSTLRMAREKKGISQEDLGSVSSRTYVSALERGLKNPTLDKIDQLSGEVGIHPLTLLVATFANRDKVDAEELLTQVGKELKQFSEQKI